MFGAAGHGLEPSGVTQPGGHLRMPLDARLHTVVAAPQRLGAAGVKRLGNEDPHAATGEGVEGCPRGVIVGAIVKTCGSRSLGCFGLGFLAGPFDDFAVDEGCSGADQGDQVGCVDGAPAVLC
jgi:hypothetical protein